MKLSIDWLKEYVTIAPPFEKVAEDLTLAGLEVEKISALTDPVKDTIFEIEVTTNRPDWLSHIGVAREIAAVRNLSLKLPPAEPAKAGAIPHGWKLDLKELDACPYYSAVMIEGIQHAETPDFIKSRLEACGIRSIGLIVDITNYVLLETGQPLHAFDADLLQGQQIRIRKAKDGEKMTAINGDVLTLSKEDLVIADALKPVALAGVMGGKDTEVTDKTRTILLESAYFNPAWVRRSARRHALSSESSYRFERRVDPEGVDFARRRALALIKTYAKPRHIGGDIKLGEKPVVHRTPIKLSAAEIQRVLGIELKSNQVMSILTRLGLSVKANSTSTWNVNVPAFRTDLVSQIDLIEELARIYGFDKIPETLPESAPIAFVPNPLLKIENKVRHTLTAAGLYETVTFSLISEQGLDEEKDLKNAVTIINPQHKELRHMRPTMLPSLLNVIKRNLHQGARQIGIFETANIYESQGRKHPKETRVLALALCGPARPKSWLDQERMVSYYDLKGMIESLLSLFAISNVRFQAIAKSCLDTDMAEEIFTGNHSVGYAGKINQEHLHAWDIENDVFFAELNLPLIASLAQGIRPIEDLPRFPAIERDLSVIVSEEVKAGEVVEIIQSLGQGLIQQVVVFDLFRGGRIPKGSKSLGFRVRYQSSEKTLVSEEIQELHTQIADSVVKKFEATFQ